MLVPNELVQKLLIHGDFHAQPSPRFTENSQKKRKISGGQRFSGSEYLVDDRGQQRMITLRRNYTKAAVTQTTICPKVSQKTTSERTACQTLKLMVYSSTGPQRLTLLSAEKQQSEVTANSPNFLLPHSDGTLKKLV